MPILAKRFLALDEGETERLEDNTITEQAKYYKLKKKILF